MQEHWSCANEGAKVFPSLSLNTETSQPWEVNMCGFTESRETSFVFHPGALELASRPQPPGELVKPIPSQDPPGAPDWANPEWGGRISFPTRAQRMLGWAGNRLPELLLGISQSERGEPRLGRSAGPWLCVLFVFQDVD